MTNGGTHEHKADEKTNTAKNEPKVQEAKQPAKDAKAKR